jgi:hypothetical protein
VGLLGEEQRKRASRRPAVTFVGRGGGTKCRGMGEDGMFKGVGWKTPCGWSGNVASDGAAIGLRVWSVHQPSIAIHHQASRETPLDRGS